MQKIFRLTLVSLSIAIYAGCVGTALDNSESGKVALKAKDSLKQKDYEEATDLYMEAIALCDSEPDKAKFYRERLSETYRDWAMHCVYGRKSKAMADYEEAIRLCENATLADPNSKRRCDEMVDEFQKRIKILKYKAEISEDKVAPDAKETRDKVAILIKQGRVLVDAKRYSDARDKFEDALRLDPYSMVATQELKRLNVKLAQAARARDEAERTGRIAEVEWKHVSPLLPKDDASSSSDPDTKPNAISPLGRTLHDTIIPSIDFNEASFKEVFEFLERQSNGELVFVFDGIDPADPKLPLIVFKAERIPLGDAIKSLCGTLELDCAPVGKRQMRISPKKSSE